MESSFLKCPSDPSSNMSGLITTEQPVCSVILPTPLGKLAMVPLATISSIVMAEVAGDDGFGGQISLIRHTLPYSMLILPVVVA